MRTVRLGPQITFLRHAPNPARINPIRNPEGRGGFPKPTGGLWTSTEATSAVDGWEAYTTTDYIGGRHDKAYILVPNRDVLQINTFEDLEGLIERYPRPTGYPEHTWDVLPATHVDWEAMVADGHTGVNLTSEGQWATRLSNPNLYGWDCESTLWFHWAFEKRATRSARP